MENQENAVVEKKEYPSGSVIVIMDTKKPGERTLEKIFIAGKDFTLEEVFEDYRKWAKVQVTKDIADFPTWLVYDGYLVTPVRVDIWKK
jgi:hypothetical protein